jgi:hypothetical protein
MAICGSAIFGLNLFGNGVFADFCRLKTPPIQKFRLSPYKQRLKMLYVARNKKFGWTNLRPNFRWFSHEKGAKFFERSVPASLSFDEKSADL